MPLLWTPDLSVGVEEIDAQHKELFARADRLLQAMRDGRGRDEVTPMLAFLDAYVRDHFQSEEDRMRRVGYPLLSAHAAEHAMFLDGLADMREACRAARANQAAIVVCDRVFTWLRRHVSRSDQQFARHLRGSRAGAV